jgi:hypothetical protein
VFIGSAGDAPHHALSSSRSSAGCNKNGCRDSRQPKVLLKGSGYGRT